MRSFPAKELATRLRVTERHAGQLPQQLMALKLAQSTISIDRYRLYGLTELSDAYSQNLRISKY